MVLGVRFSIMLDIFAINDDKEIPEVLAIYAKKSGLKFRGETNIDLAIKSISELKPKIVIVDIIMPEMDGISVLKKIKKEHPDQIVGVLSSKESDFDKEVALDNGAQFFANKPISHDEFNGLLKPILKSF